MNGVDGGRREFVTYVRLPTEPEVITHTSRVRHLSDADDDTDDDDNDDNDVAAAAGQA